MNGASKRCASTIWKASPAAMYSFALRDHRLVFVRRGVRVRRHVERACVVFGQRLVERPVEAFDNAGQPLDGARERRLGVDAFFRAHRRHHGDRVLHRVEHDDDASAAPGPRRECRSDPDWAAAALPSAAPCRSRDSRTRRPPSAAGCRARRCGFPRSARATPASGGSGQGAKASGLCARGAVDFGLARRWCARSGPARGR